MYSNGNQMDKMDQVFNEFLKSEYYSNAATWGSYLHGYCKLGDIIKMEEIIELMKEYNIKKSDIMYGTIMKGYLNSQKYNKVLEIYDEMINNRIKPGQVSIYLKYCAYVSLQLHSETEIDRTMYYDKIKNEIKLELKKYDIKPEFKLRNLLLKSKIIEYSHNNPQKIVKYFEKNEQYYPYWKYDNKSNSWLINLHQYYHIECQFILRYIFAYKLSEFPPNKDVCIITGYGKHNDLSKKNALKSFIEHEISQWEPSMHCYQNTSHPGSIYIPYSSIIKCIENNPTLQYMENGSLNWYRYEDIMKNDTTNKCESLESTRFNVYNLSDYIPK